MAQKNYLFISSLIVLTFSSYSFAAFNTKTVLSESQKTFAQGDQCLVTSKIPEASYSDKDAKNETALCLLDFINSSQTGICPKLHNTNPALEIHSLKQTTKADFEKNECAVISQGGARNEKKIAKFKMTMTCSYAPSLITYYHISRALGDIVNVPVSVYRTLPRAYVAQKASQAAIDSKKIAQKLQTKAARDNALIWNSTATKLSSSALDDKYITQDGKFAFGAIVNNPTNEKDYLDIMNDANGIQLERGKAFMKERPFLDLSNQDKLTDIISTYPSIDNIQRLANMIDVSDMILIDTLLNQEDRYNNIAYEEDTYLRKFPNSDQFLIEEDGSFKKISKTEIEQTKTPSEQIISLKRIVLKDNDCGVSRSNINQKLGIFSALKHIKPETYQKFLALALKFKNDTLKDYFLNHLNLSSADYSSLKSNALTMADNLYKDCHAGLLKQDLSFKSHFGLKPASTSCDLINIKK